jgi:hypothetical protein
MPKHTTDPVDDSPSGPGGRRALLAAGATAALGAVGVALARPADAAPGGPLLLGRTNTSATVSTVVTSTNSNYTLSSQATAGHAVLGDTTSNARNGVYGRNRSTTHGTGLPGAGVRGDGGRNVGVIGTTGNQNEYGIVGLNTAVAVGSAGAVVGDGTTNPGVVAFTEAPAKSAPALYASGASGWAAWLDGEARVDGALLVGVPGATAGTTDYRPVASTEAAVHTTSGRATLDGTGAVTVTLPAAFLAAATVTAADAVVQLTAMDGAMPGLFATVTATTVGIAGGTAAGSVSWTITAPRKAAPGTLAVVARPAPATTAARAPRRPGR